MKSWLEWMQNKRGFPCFVYSHCEKVLEMLKSRSHVFTSSSTRGRSAPLLCGRTDQQILFSSFGVHFPASCHSNKDGGACAVWFRKLEGFFSFPLGWCWQKVWGVAITGRGGAEQGGLNSFDWKIILNFKGIISCQCWHHSDCAVSLALCFEAAYVTFPSQVSLQLHLHYKHILGGKS